MESAGFETHLAFLHHSRDEHDSSPQEKVTDSQEEFAARSESRPRSSSLRRRIHSFLDRSPSKTLAHQNSTGSLCNKSDSSGSSPLPPLPRPNVQQRSTSRQRSAAAAKSKGSALQHDSKSVVLERVERIKNSRRVKPGELANTLENWSE